MPTTWAREHSSIVMQGVINPRHPEMFIDRARIDWRHLTSVVGCSSEHDFHDGQWLLEGDVNSIAERWSRMSNLPANRGSRYKGKARR